MDNRLTPSRTLGASRRSQNQGEPPSVRYAERLGNALSEDQLIAAHGVCGRCLGVGFIHDQFNGLRQVGCPSCQGTGRKGG